MLVDLRWKRGRRVEKEEEVEEDKDSSAEAEGLARELLGQEQEQEQEPEPEAAASVRKSQTEARMSGEGEGEGADAVPDMRPHIGSSRDKGAGGPERRHIARTDSVTWSERDWADSDNESDDGSGHKGAWNWTEKIVGKGAKKAASEGGGGGGGAEVR